MQSTFEGVLARDDLLISLDFILASKNGCAGGPLVLRSACSPQHLHDLEIRILLRASITISYSALKDNHVAREVNAHGQSRRAADDVDAAADEALLDCLTIFWNEAGVMEGDASDHKSWGTSVWKQKRRRGRSYFAVPHPSLPLVELGHSKASENLEIGPTCSREREQSGRRIFWSCRRP